MTVTLEGNTLGEKQQHYNKLVQDAAVAAAEGNYQLNKIDYEDSDLANLLKIDIACITRSVDYIIEVLKSDDMLYVSRAIKKSVWLITDAQYANIINPEYLDSQLFPSMHTKAVNKLMLSIRLHLREPSRVEAFYNHLKGSNSACKWLFNCSRPFIEEAIQHERSIPIHVLKRLSKKYISVFSYYEPVRKRKPYIDLYEYWFLFRSQPTEFLDVLETQEYCSLHQISRKHTEVLMNKYSQRILDKFDFYMNYIDMSVVAKHVAKNTCIKAFLEKIIKNDKVKYRLYRYDNLKHFIKNMPEEEQYPFVKQTFIDKANVIPNDALPSSSQDEPGCVSGNIESFYWYKYAPYNEAYNNLIKLMRAESSPSVRCSILSVLIKCVRKNPQHLKSLLKYYYKKHINEPFKFKIQFVNNVLTQIPSHRYDVETWNILDQIFHSLGVYSESEDDVLSVQTCLRAIIIYKVIHDAVVPDIVIQKFKFDTFINSCNKLHQEHQEKLFSYLLNPILGQIQTRAIENESDFDDTVRELHYVLSLLIDWKKDICDYPFILDHLKTLIIIHRDNFFNTDLSRFYNMKKSWRKYMFEDSFAFCLNEEVCLNALKHNPQLLAVYDKELETLRTNDKVTLRRLLAKLRVYWPQSIAQQWTDAYLLNLDKATGQKAAIRGLFMLMTQKQIVDMADKHKPEDTKIKWGRTNATDINLRKYIAQSLHVARPLVPIETVLSYAKQDYLQYAVPSMNAVMHYMSKERSRDCLTMLLEAPVSLQKFGIRYAFVKLRPDELKAIYSNIWLSTNNLSIRAAIFTHTYNLLCKANKIKIKKNETVESELWALLSTFIDNLSCDDNNEIFYKLTKLKGLPLGVQPDFFMRCYNFLMLLPKRANGQMFVDRLLLNAPKIIGLLDEDFVIEKFFTPLDKMLFSTTSCQTIDLLSIFVLSSKDEEVQLRRHRRVLIPTLELAFESWAIDNDQLNVTTKNVRVLLYNLIWNFVKLVSLAKITPPAKLFTEIQKLMEEKMSIHDNYVLYTSWKLSTEYVKLIDENKSLLSVFEAFANSSIKNNVRLPDDIVSLWNDINPKISQKLGLKYLEHLKKDTEQYFPTVQMLFGNAMQQTFRWLNQGYVLTVDTLSHMLDEEFVPSYVVVSTVLPKHRDTETRETRAVILEKLRAHASEEVRMHYNFNLVMI